MIRLITSESVSVGHPDKVSDQISDAILDAYLTVDPNSKVAVEVMVKDNCVVLGGEVLSHHIINYDEVVKNTIKQIGYVNPDHGFYYNNITIINLIGKQSPEINSAIINSDTEFLGAGDQGFMTGYATNETKDFMPLGVYISKKVVDYVYQIPQLGPDIKSQTTMEYSNNKKRVHSILISTMHNVKLSVDKVRETVTNGIKLKLINIEDGVYDLIDSETKIIVNPSGTWNIGGPVSDCGVTGRKIVVDQYGPYNPVGGGAFSGKDPSKVDRSGAYLARYIAKNIVASGVTSKCSVEISYIIGLEKPSSLNINTFGECNDDELVKIVMDKFPLKPYDVIKHFNLKTPIYLESSKSHFGNDKMPWEKLDMTHLF